MGKSRSKFYWKSKSKTLQDVKLLKFLIFEFIRDDYWPDWWWIFFWKFNLIWKTLNACKMESIKNESNLKLQL
jgi:hypothetical protein